MKPSRSIAFRSCVFALLLLSCGSGKDNPAAAGDSTGVVDADHPSIQYVGRFDRTDPKAPAFDWPGVTIAAAFEGTSCSLRLRDSGNFYSVSIDG
jgi:hypothetical protein